MAKRHSGKQQAAVPDRHAADAETPGAAAAELSVETTVGAPGDAAAAPGTSPAAEPAVAVPLPDLGTLDLGIPEQRITREIGRQTGPVSRITLGLKALVRDNPWPEFGYGEIEPFYLALDGNGRGGRELIIDAIKERKITLMFEVGCFLCGSTLQWLRASENLTVVGIDPWDGNWAAYISEMAYDPAKSRNVWHLTEKQHETIVSNLRRHGNFCVALNNVRLYKTRFFPVRRRSPEAFAYLYSRQIVPELIYIDAGKHRDDLEAAHRLFPKAILCGDDWLWPDASGAMRMQEHVKSFAEEFGFEVRSLRQTWLLTPSALLAPKP